MAVTHYVAGIGSQVIPVEVKGNRVFNRQKLFLAAQERGVWAQVKQYLVDNDLYDNFVMASTIPELDEDFKAGVEAAKNLLGLDDDGIEAILAECVESETV